MSKVDTIIAAIPTMQRSEIEAHWNKLGAGEAPRLPDPLFRRLTAQILQERRYGDVPAIIRRELSAAGLTVYGGEQAPYVWIQTPEGVDSWGFFDLLLNKANVVGTPGSGFGAAGEGYFRLSAFNSRENVLEAMRRIQAALAPAAAAA